MLRALWRLSLLFWFFVFSNLSAKLSNAEEFVWKSAEAHAEAIARNKATDRMIAVEISAAEIDAESEINALVQIVDLRWKAYVSDANIAYGKDRTWLKVQAMWSMLNNAKALHEALVNAANAAQAYERDFKHQATKYSAAFLNSWVVKNEEAMETLESDLKEQWGRLQNELRIYAQNEKKKDPAFSRSRGKSSKGVVQGNADKILVERSVADQGARRATPDELRQAQIMSAQLTARGIGITPAQALALIWTEQDLCGTSRDCE